MIEIQTCFPQVLDACCGPRMMWFDSKDKRALFIDKRQESFLIRHSIDRQNERKIDIAPDIIADFTCMPFENESFYVVVFDPPHLNISRTGGNRHVSHFATCLNANQHRRPR